MRSGTRLADRGCRPDRGAGKEKPPKTERSSGSFTPSARCAAPGCGGPAAPGALVVWADREWVGDILAGPSLAFLMLLGGHRAGVPALGRHNPGLHFSMSCSAHVPARTSPHLEPRGRASGIFRSGKTGCTHSSNTPHNQGGGAGSGFSLPRISHNTGLAAPISFPSAPATPAPPELIRSWW